MLSMREALGLNRVLPLTGSKQRDEFKLSYRLQFADPCYKQISFPVQQFSQWCFIYSRCSFIFLFLPIFLIQGLSVAQAGLELTVLPSTSQGWGYRCVLPAQWISPSISVSSLSLSPPTTKFPLRRQGLFMQSWLFSNSLFRTVGICLSAFQSAGLNACTTTPGLIFISQSSVSGL